MSKKILICAGVVMFLVGFWQRYHFHKARSLLTLDVITTNLSRNAITADTPWNGFPFLLNGAHKCTSRAPFLVLLIPSMPQDTSTRDVIRRTWGNETLMPGVDIIRMFLMGVSKEPATFAAMQTVVLNENATFGDIIQQDFLDTYNNLTIKTMMGMEWVATYCPRASYIMKIDSDMFFNPLFLVKQLLQPNLPVKKDYFTGCVIRWARPFRNKDSKWYMPTEVYSRDAYPTYCSGTGYVLSSDLATKIYHAAPLLKPMHMEDVFMGLCLEKLGIAITSPPDSLFHIERIEYERCRFTKLITVHHYTKEELVQLWPGFMEATRSC